MTSVQAFAPKCCITAEGRADELLMASMAACSVSTLALPCLTAVLIAPVPIGFVKSSTSPGLAPAFVITFRVNNTGDRIAKFHLLVVNRVPADDNNALGIHCFLSAGEDLSRAHPNRPFEDNRRSIMQIRASRPSHRCHSAN